MILPIWVYLTASSLGFSAGSVFLKRYADLGGALNLTVSFAIFAASNLIYAQVLARGLGQGAVLCSMVQILIMCGLGVVLFGERLGFHQLAGLVLAIGSVWLFSMTGETA